MTTTPHDDDSPDVEPDDEPEPDVDIWPHVANDSADDDDDLDMPGTPLTGRLELEGDPDDHHGRDDTAVGGTPDPVI